MKNTIRPSAASSGRHSPTFHHDGSAIGNSRTLLSPDVGIGSCRAMSDVEREQFIANCTYLMEQAYADYEARGCFADRGTADRWRILRDEAVRSRSPQQVLALEIKRGLI